MKSFIMKTTRTFLIATSLTGCVTIASLFAREPNVNPPIDLIISPNEMKKEIDISIGNNLIKTIKNNEYTRFDLETELFKLRQQKYQVLLDKCDTARTGLDKIKSETHRMDYYSYLRYHRANVVLYLNRRTYVSAKEQNKDVPEEYQKICDELDEVNQEIDYVVKNL